MRTSLLATIACLVLAATTVGAPAPTGVAAPTAASISSVRSAAVPKAAKYKFKNCTSMNKVYPHGVGRSNAKDKTSGTPVTTFKRSTTLYKKIIGHRSGLDRDKDGIACERR